MRTRYPVAGAVGILTFLVTLSALFIPSHVQYETMSADEIARTMETDGYLQAAQAYSHALGATALSAWILLVYLALRRTGRSADPYAATTLASGMAVSAFLLVPAAFTLAAYGNRDVIEPLTFRALHLASWTMMFLVVFLTPVFLASIGLSIRKTGIAPRWLGAAALALAGLHLLVSPVSILKLDVTAPVLFLPYVLLLVWVLVASIGLWVGTERPSTSDVAASNAPEPTMT